MRITPTRRTRIADAMRAAIAEKGLPLGSVAKAAGISTKTLRRRIDGGESSFSVDELAAVCAFLEIPFMGFIALTDAPQADPGSPAGESPEVGS